MYGPILKGKKVILQPAKMSEAEKFRRWMDDEEVTRHISSEGGLTLEQEKEFLKKAKNHPVDLFWSVYTKDGKLIGNTALNAYSPKNKRASWGIVIGDKAEWNKGYGTDILKTVMAYVFKQLKLNRFELMVFQDNAAAIKVYKRCGLKKEGIRRKYFIKNGKPCDLMIMSILSDEYKKLKK